MIRVLPIRSAEFEAAQYDRYWHASYSVHQQLVSRLRAENLLVVKYARALLLRLRR